MGSPASEFQGGLTNEDQVGITLTRAFLVGRHEVTRQEWESVGLAPVPNVDSVNGSDCVESDCPVAGVSWHDALAFANAMSARASLPDCYDLSACSGTVAKDFECKEVHPVGESIYACRGYRLPTEAEWEYATRAGTTTTFFSGPIRVISPPTGCEADPSLEPIAWYCFNATKMTHRVMQKVPNPWGLYDVAGNVTEWVNDAYDPSGYSAGGNRDPFPRFASASATAERVTRGGLAIASSALCRSAARLPFQPTTRIFSIGFRLARTE